MTSTPTRPTAPMHAPTKAMLEAARAVRAPRGSTPATKKAYRDAAMLRAYWQTSENEK